MYMCWYIVHLSGATPLPPGWQGPTDHAPCVEGCGLPGEHPEEEAHAGVGVQAEADFSAGVQLADMLVRPAHAHHGRVGHL